MNNSAKKIISCAGLSGALLVSPVYAQDAQPDLEQLKQQLDAQSRELAAERRALEEQEAKLAATKRSLAEQQRRLNALQAQITGKPGPAQTPQTEQTPSQAKVPPAQGAATPQPVGQAPETSTQGPEIPALVETRGVLTPRHTLNLEPSLQYSHSSNNRVSILGFAILPALTIGLIDVRNVNRDTFIGNLSARYGITNRFEVEARAPYVYREDSTTSRPIGMGASQDSVFNAKGHDIGDVEFAARYQLNEGGFEKPYYIGSLRYKTRTGTSPFDVATDPASGLQTELPTGSGFDALQPGISAIFPSDPVVFFGGVNYLWNIKRNVGIRNGANFGTIDPGDAIGFNFGMGLALNEKASFSISYDHARLATTEQNGVEIPLSQTTQLGTLQFGFSYRLTDKTNMNLNFGLGVTEDAPDLQLTLRFPTSFF